MTDTFDNGASADRRPRQATCEVAFEDGRPAMSVVEAVARATDVPPKHVTPRLSEVIDPDALDRLFLPCENGRPRQPGLVRFEMGGLDVVVDWGADRVRVYETDET